MSLPGADELFRTTGGGMGLQSSSPADRRRKANGEPRVPAPAGESDPSGQGGAPAESREEHASADAEDSRGRGGGGDRQAAAASAPPSGDRSASAAPAEQSPAVQQQRRRGGGRGANRRPSGRERHDEKITVYVSAEELMDLEHARLVLRGEHGLAVDRGRIVREAVAVVLADLESRGDASILVRRLRGR
ncbi:hypothetical protein AMK21_27385 [Streptomyces sp. CB00316]|uniref:hypothetical protein n=1 Tax=unclassified Streptomyces TaxID=2593676 RepID=UPI000939004C|nr:MULTISPECIES: hypothetical protein [unclassified Streptomyces]MBT2378394.1 hypothetical protein [Streptomyces sp. ISL-111]MBT2429275.1 hypothetical protein [Streptomyces sp. ISL-112]MBT2466028.1 hypothetical protein [Streptomyces sp. ISL-63]OKJ16533.1 hypothetical protein AMK21_27385 [Streptomyces sp. CB00316]